MNLLVYGINENHSMVKQLRFNPECFDDFVNISIKNLQMPDRIISIERELSRYKRFN